MADKETDRGKSGNKRASKTTGNGASLSQIERDIRKQRKPSQIGKRHWNRDGESMRLLAEYREFIVGLAVIGLVMTGYYIGKLEREQQ